MSLKGFVIYLFFVLVIDIRCIVNVCFDRNRANDRTELTP